MDCPIGRASAVFPLFPEASVAVFAFEQLSLGEAFEAEGGDVHGFGHAVEDEFDEAGTRGGGGLEARAAQPAGEIKTVEPRRAVDRALVWGDTVAPNVDGMQAALFDPGNALHHVINEFFEEGNRGRLVFGVGRFAAQGLVFARGQNECAALRAKVAVDDVVDHCRNFAKRWRTVEEGDIVSPCLERDLDPCEACDPLCPRPGRVDEDRRVEITSCGAEAGHAST